MAEDIKIPIKKNNGQNKGGSQVMNEVQKILSNSFGDQLRKKKLSTSLSADKGDKNLNKDLSDSEKYFSENLAKNRMSKNQINSLPSGTDSRLSNFSPSKNLSMSNFSDSGKSVGATEKEVVSGKSASAESQEISLADELERDKKASKENLKIDDSKVSVDKKENDSEKPISIRLFFDKFLKSAWLNVVATLTLSMFWVYIHAVLSLLSPKFFCKLGQEWVPEEVKKMSPKKAKDIGGKIGVIEKGAAGCCCFLHLFIIIIAFLVMLLTPPISFVIAPYIAWEWLSSFFQ